MKIVFMLVLTCLGTGMVINLVPLMAWALFALSPHIGTQTISRARTCLLLYIVNDASKNASYYLECCISHIERCSGTGEQSAVLMRQLHRSS